MYYLVTEYELYAFAYKTTRRLITIGNKDSFADLYDYFPAAVEGKKLIMPEDELKDFMKDGFQTKEEAENANEVKNAIKNFVGAFFNGEFKVMSEEELLKKYEALK